MTDQTIHDVTDDERRRAREWAEGIEANPKSWSLLTRTAARVVLDTVPVPAPTPPTLADMTEEERAACIRMQCDTAPNRSVRGFIADIYPGGCRVIERDTWQWRSCSDDMVTPRPDLPRMEWPGNQKPMPAPALPEGWRLADHEDHGRILVTNTTPNRNGYVYYVHSSDRDLTRFHWDSCTPDELTYPDQEAEDVTPAKAGDVIASADDPRISALPIGSILLDRDGDTVTKERETWAGLGCIPIPDEGDEFGPWTVLHVGREVDQ